MFDENKKLLKFEDEEFNLEVDYQNKNSVSQDTIERVSIKDSSMDDILDVEYENKKQTSRKVLILMIQAIYQCLNN